MLELRELTGVGMLEGKKVLEANRGSLERAIEYLRLTGDEPELTGLTERRWIVTLVDGSENVYFNNDEFENNYKPMRGDSALYVSPVGRHQVIR